ncbi:MAG: hypothetical protein LUB59_01975, partial [Candidatus Gastranaerophilales bacterium]|nr:hypothetical protein [Candidatus Gastranaerophilales bacterium]
NEIIPKKSRTSFEIFLQGVGLYFSNIDRFVWYMLFPVAGQLAGLFLTVMILYCYNEYHTLILSHYPVLKSPMYMKIGLCAVLFPAVLIWLKSFWEYVVAYSAVNSMTENMLKSERVYDFPAHTMMVTRRYLPYIGLCGLYFSIIILTAVPIFFVFGLILLTYYAFIFQIFIFEPELSPYECFKKSSAYVSGNFKQTLLMIILAGGLTYVILPQIILAFVDTIKGVDYLKGLLVKYISVPSLDAINMVLSATGAAQLTPQQVALFVVQALIIIIVIQLLLPLRVICMCLWYKNFYNNSGAMKKIDERILESAGADKRKRRKK